LKGSRVERVKWSPYSLYENYDLIFFGFYESTFNTKTLGHKYPLLLGKVLNDMSAEG
jgi:hypothetical protein